MAAAPYRTDSDFAGKSPSAGNFFVAYEEGEGMKTVRGVELTPARLSNVEKQAGKQCL